MASTAARLLRLIALMQNGRDWPGAALAERLGIHPRSVRRDIERLRELGYPIRAVSGIGGGYRLGHGAAALPLLFEEDEALTVAIALRAAAPAIAGLDDAAARVLTKLDPLLPRRHQQRASTAHAAMASLPTAAPGSLVDASMLTLLAGACRDRTTLQLEYRRHSGEQIRRRVEPALLVNYGRRWYLLAWDCERQDWRTLRADRIDQAQPTGMQAQARALPDEPLQLLRKAIGEAPFPHRARVRLCGSLQELAARVPPWLGALEADGTDHCWLGLGAPSLPALAANLLLLEEPFEALAPDHLRAPLCEALTQLRTRLEHLPASTGEDTWQVPGKLGHSAA
ncbi:WYL domain-containing protein [Xanthomonas campestris pv. incanae]|uniref:helix-turn-helix transcriptional regulator n=1 Tax=Xanthomonas campestris TaxID=339 RepID=UPI001D13A0D9|nr:WYL domain-containing protein [Xanthomonas campestris]MCC3252370.1 WYL domain-containing protein [Xanthomonas campestris pv. armoraciae]MDX6081022.1 WYL domain-containing protein [Xanthomonas campestris pv. incanae]MDX6085649.1 WYL domain-containing protein [Xanthomonas campestris pv. incanae]MDX6138859.1 WYL domain-containing protein [Xanthomonas campestris pv. incanae]